MENKVLVFGLIAAMVLGVDIGLSLLASRRLEGVRVMAAGSAIIISGMFLSLCVWLLWIVGLKRPPEGSVGDLLLSPIVAILAGGGVGIVAWWATYRFYISSARDSDRRGH